MRIEGGKETASFLRENGYKFISEISFSRDVLGGKASPFCVRVVLANVEGREATLRAVGCIDVKIGDINGLKGVFIDIEDVSGYQIEGVRYKVWEYENGMFNFYCQEFDLFEGRGR
ncbi:MAG: hypothetical protein AcusKO_16130 [Acuticoccus sp.]